MSEMTRSLSEAERLRQIGELLYGAIDWSKVPVTVEEPEARLVTIASTNDSGTLTSPESRVVHYLRRVGEASPAVLRTVLHMPKTSAYRVIQGMVDAGSIRGFGQTRSLVYRLPPHEQNVEDN